MPTINHEPWCFDHSDDGGETCVSEIRGFGEMRPAPEGFAPDNVCQAFLTQGLQDREPTVHVSWGLHNATLSPTAVRAIVDGLAEDTVSLTGALEFVEALTEAKRAIA